MRTPESALLAPAALLALIVWTGTAAAQTAKDDPLVRMPGSQPAPEGSVALEGPGRCLNCHGGYQTAIEPGHNWLGSMMAQSARDFVFWSCMTVAAQDAQWAVGSKNATDLCLRCHFPAGWLAGRSDPTNASAMTGADYDGVHCDFCHAAFDPFYETTHLGTREGHDWLGYWDETNASQTPSQPAADATYAEDSRLAAAISRFAGGAKDLPFFTNGLPPAGYTENASGQFFISTTRDKRASFADAEARHGMYYSRYHKSRYFCATCHDVSNPVLANLGHESDSLLPSEALSAHSYYHVERTFSEFMLSAYGRDGGAPGIGPFAPTVFVTSLDNNNISKCQDCHMRDGVGSGCDKNGVPIRPHQSVEHPESGQPIHDLTGGNVWVPYVLASTVVGSPNYDAFNDSILNQGPSVLTLDMTQGEGLDPVALLDAVSRAGQQLELAASIQNVAYNPSNGSLSFRVQNQTGHKLISGFPEGRRMFVNVKAYAGSSLIYEVNPYDVAAGTLKGLGYPYLPDPENVVVDPTPLDPAAERYVDELVYETHPSSTLTGESETFHFVLATDRYKDNRIPPQGFRIAEAAQRICVPRWHGAPAPEYFTANEYAGGFDDVALAIAPGATYVEVDLYYQTTSREYMEFLRDEINGTGNLTLDNGDPANYIVQTDPFFAQLRAWGDAIWKLWTHNKDVPGAAPYRMTQGTYGQPPAACTAPVPTLLDATPASGQVTLTWSDEHASDPLVLGYRIYYDQANKEVLWADVGLSTTFVDQNLNNGLQYCYKVTSYHAACESDFSNALCATPNAGGQLRAGVNWIRTGAYVTTGGGRNQVTVFEEQTQFTAGDEVVFRAHVVDGATALPLEGASITLTITGPETLQLTATSDPGGVAEARWATIAPKKRNPGTTPGSYLVTTTGLSASGYAWDDVATDASISIQ